MVGRRHQEIGLECVLDEVDLSADPVLSVFLGDSKGGPTFFPLPHLVVDGEGGSSSVSDAIHPRSGMISFRSGEHVSGVYGGHQGGGQGVASDFFTKSRDTHLLEAGPSRFFRDGQFIPAQFDDLLPKRGVPRGSVPFFVDRLRVCGNEIAKLLHRKFFTQELTREIAQHFLFCAEAEIRGGGLAHGGFPLG